MSTLEREVVVDAVLPPTSMALVPLAGPAPRDDGIVLATPVQAGDPYRVFYVMGYVSLAMFVLAAWVRPWDGGAALGLGAVAGLMLGLAGLGVLIHVLVRASLAKFRKGLGAVAALVLTLVSLGPIGRAAEEVYVNGRIMALQPLAEEISRDRRIWHLGEVRAPWVDLNGYSGSMEAVQSSYTDPAAPPPLRFDEVLRRDGISRAEVERYGERMRAAGTDGVWQMPGYSVFHIARNGTVLLYVHPGHALPPRNAQLMYTREGWRSRPMGGGWYLLW